MISHTGFEPEGNRTDAYFATYVIEELNQSIGSQLSIILNDFIVSKDINALHLIQTLSKRKCGKKRKLGMGI